MPWRIIKFRRKNNVMGTVVAEKTSMQKILNDLQNLSIPIEQGKWKQFETNYSKQVTAPDLAEQVGLSTICITKHNCSDLNNVLTYSKLKNVQK